MLVSALKGDFMDASQSLGNVFHKDGMTSDIATSQRTSRAALRVINACVSNDEVGISVVLVLISLDLRACSLWHEFEH